MCFLSMKQAWKSAKIQYAFPQCRLHNHGGSNFRRLGMAFHEVLFSFSFQLWRFDLPLASASSLMFFTTVPMYESNISHLRSRVPLSSALD